MNKVETLLKAGWTRIPYARIRDSIDGVSSIGASKKLTTLFERHRLDISKRHRKWQDFESRAWLFIEDPAGELIRPESLKAVKC